MHGGLQFTFQIKNKVIHTQKWIIAESQSTHFSEHFGFNFKSLGVLEAEI
jgi:hypothetical protein